MNFDNNHGPSILPNINASVFARMFERFYFYDHIYDFLLELPNRPEKFNYTSYRERFINLFNMPIRSSNDGYKIFESVIEYFHLEEWLNSDYTRSYLWTILLESWTIENFRNRNRDYYTNNIGDIYLAQIIPGYRYKTYGFFDTPDGRSNFGVTLFASFNTENSQNVTERETEEYSRIPKFIEFDDYRFPIIIRRINEYMHNTVSSPIGGIGACYAKSKISSRTLGPGVLTAKHVVGNMLGTKIHLTCSCVGKVIDVAPDGIDAALVSCKCSNNPDKQIKPVKYIAPWMDVEFEDALSRKIKTKVTSITDTKGIFKSAILPSRIFIAHAGKPGDSGALITEVGTKRPVGIYMGEYIDAAGQGGGIAQNAFQITEIMDMELYI